MLATGRLSAEQAADFAHIIARQALRVGRMIEDLEFTSAEARNAGPGGEFDLSNVSSETVLRMEPDAAARGVTLKVHPFDCGARGPGWAEFYQSVLFWIVEVGIRVSRAGEVVEISFDSVDDRAFSRVRMSAAGLDEAMCAGLAGFSVEAALPDPVRGIAGPLRLSLDNFMEVGGRVVSELRGDALEWTLILPDGSSRRAA